MISAKRSLSASTSKFAKLLNWNFQDVVEKNDSLELIYSDKETNQKLIVPLVWLRDHCSSAKSFNRSTNQRTSKFTDSVEKSVADQISIGDQQDKIRIRWKDGHQSEFEMKNLISWAVFKKIPKITTFLNLWSREKLKEVPTIHRNSLKFDDFSNFLIKYGVVIVDGIEHTPEETEKLCKSLVPVHDTFFGQFWVFSNNESEDEPAHEDTAYGNEDIGPHTDGTYFNQTPGIQVFHCLQPAKSGGDTVLVDAFHCADKLREHSPESFEILTTTKISHHYLEGNPPGSAIHSLSTEKPVIEVDSNGNIVQIRFNPYDRAPFRQLSSTKHSALQVIKFYKAYQEFSRLCHDTSNALLVRLEPGSVIFIDNFRVLHSRTSFNGYRRMCGCYLSRDNFLAKSRPIIPSEFHQSI